MDDFESCSKANYFRTVVLEPKKKIMLLFQILFSLAVKDWGGGGESDLCQAHFSVAAQ